MIQENQEGRTSFKRLACCVHWHRCILYIALERTIDNQTLGRPKYFFPSICCVQEYQNIQVEMTQDNEVTLLSDSGAKHKKGGRTVGAEGYREDDIDALLSIVEEYLPAGSSEWEAVLKQ
jgi:hypothetical protein